ncbi:hypothetical protein [Ruegeria sp.]|uniref:hypothetical protein n=1 Tax=Ruegeria sp. TaxID=1879320 RepID=UPI002328F866|nr:hypothetical protein [Ruegeria sp.]MDA7966136.1 hypothetical protein [Ruegeria sp.]
MTLEFWTLIVLFLLGLFVSALSPSKKSSEETFRRHITVGILFVLVALSATLLTSEIILLDTGGVGAEGQEPASPTTGEDNTAITAFEAITALAIGLIGLVITGMTGMALAGAWRAMDEANRAEEAVKKLQEKERDLEQQILKHMVQLQAKELLARDSRSKGYQMWDHFLRARVLQERKSILGQIVEDDEQRKQVRGAMIYEGKQYLEHLMQDTRDDSFRENLGKLLYG